MPNILLENTTVVAKEIKAAKILVDPIADLLPRQHVMSFVHHGLLLNDIVIITSTKCAHTILPQSGMRHFQEIRYQIIVVVCA